MMADQSLRLVHQDLCVGCGGMLSLTRLLSNSNFRGFAATGDKGRKLRLSQGAREDRRAGEFELPGTGGGGVGNNDLPKVDI